MKILSLAFFLCGVFSPSRAWDPNKPFIYEMKIAFETDNWANHYSTTTILSKSDNLVAFSVVANSTYSPTYQLVVTTQGCVGIATNTASPAGIFTVGDGTLTVTAGGCVGIGTAAPAAKLDVAGMIKSQNPGSVAQGTGWTSPVSYSDTFYIAGSYSLTGTGGGTQGVYTNLKDQGGAFNASTGIFTAPISGFYLVTLMLTPGGSGRLLINASLNGAYPGEIYDITAEADSSDYSWSGIIYLEAGQTHRILRHGDSVPITVMVIGYHLL